MSDTDLDKRIVYLAYRDIFKDKLAKLRKRSKIRKVVEKHKDHLYYEQSAVSVDTRKTCRILGDLLAAGLFESKSAAEATFPTLLSPSGLGSDTTMPNSTSSESAPVARQYRVDRKSGRIRKPTRVTTKPIRAKLKVGDGKEAVPKEVFCEEGEGRTHQLIDNSRHNACPRCPYVADFDTERQLDQHHCIHNSGTGSRISSNALSIKEILVEYLGLDRSVITPVFAFAVRHRSQQPTVDFIVRHTKTTLDEAIVSALLAAALRLLPVENTPQGVARRIEKQRVRTVEAQIAEDAFVAGFRRLGYDFLTENEQKASCRSPTLTPDIRFKAPTLVCGHLCWWVEYKDFFGFRANPFVARSNKKQFRRYTMEIGPGAVVYKLGFETGYVDIEGVKVLREREATQSLTAQPVH
ncbi:uncharacterized protein BP5553_03762 [Venustampulla echinocandica]|uniref:CDAN1-interacting nuclease 1 n=1 Tax=Venustampulla echinocandica TaxID=2656787 RepID=A0A370TV55_9HELO|nr:uncharacterized protein BP5553_03762 [Venustampulla echinocandica]RDL39422.1 hypothetical protein BP5553_03762 [Venustampulla echinocandica]